MHENQPRCSGTSRGNKPPMPWQRGRGKQITTEIQLYGLYTNITRNLTTFQPQGNAQIIV